MTKAEFLQFLKKYNINENLVVFSVGSLFSEKEGKNMTV